MILSLFMGYKVKENKIWYQIKYTPGISKLRLGCAEQHVNNKLTESIKDAETPAEEITRVRSRQNSGIRIRKYYDYERSSGSYACKKSGDGMFR